MSEAVGHYKLLERIGAGGLGDVYRARDTKLGRTVAIKVPPPELTIDPVRRAALLQQAHAVARLSHPSIATLFDVGEEQGRMYLVFEYVPGQPLSTVIGGRPLNPRRAIELGIQLADALAEAHAEDLIHGDLRPDNIVVTPKDRAKFLDFGMFAFTQGGAARDALASGAGGQRSRKVAPYTPPEDGDVPGTGGDIFALGCVLFEMLTGRQAFGHSTGRPAPLPSIIIRAIPTELDPVVGRAIALDPQARYQSAATLSAELRGVAAILDIRTAAQEAEFVDERPSRTGRRILWIVMLLALGMAIAALWTWREQARFQWRRWFGSPSAPVLVVVPFEVEGTMPTITADGVAEDLANRLGTIKGLKVVGRSSLRSQRGRDLRTIAQAAHAAVALVGTIRSTDYGIAMDATLVDAATGATLWTRTLSSTKTEILAAEATLTGEVARALGLPSPTGVASARAASRVVDASAYDFYLRGRDAEARGNLADAADLYERAVAVDGSLAEGYAAFATASYRELVRSARLDDLSDESSWQRLRNAAENAASADPDLPAAQLAAGLAATTLGEALPAFRRAMELDPSRGDLYGQLAHQIRELDPSRAESLYRMALDLEAGLVDSVAGLAELLVFLDRYSDADQLIERLRKESSANVPWKRVQGLRELMAGRPSGAIGVLEDAVERMGDPTAALLSVRARVAAGQKLEALKEATTLTRQYPGFCEAHALRVGLLMDTGAEAAARDAARTILDDAAAPGAPPVRVRCAAIAAASIGNGDLAGQWLERIAVVEPDLRVWALPLAGVSGQTALLRNWYPWQKVGTTPAVVKGRTAVQTAYRRLRDQIAELLPTIRGSQPASR